MGAFPLTDDPAAAIAEHGRGLKIIDAVMDNLQLTSTDRQGTTVHFEKKLEWLPGTAGQRLFNTGDGRNLPSAKDDAPFGSLLNVSSPGPPRCHGNRVTTASGGPLHAARRAAEYGYLVPVARSAE
jgi:hypothetical protein